MTDARDPPAQMATVSPFSLSKNGKVVPCTRNAHDLLLDFPGGARAAERARLPEALWPKSALRSGVHHCAHRQSAARLPVRHAHRSPRCCLRGAAPPPAAHFAAWCSHHRRVAARVRAARQAKGHGRAGQCGRDEGARCVPHAIERAAICAAHSLGGPAVVPEMAASARAFAGMHDVVGRELRVTVVVGWR